MLFGYLVRMDESGDTRRILITVPLCMARTIAYTVLKLLTHSLLRVIGKGRQEVPTPLGWPNDE